MNKSKWKYGLLGIEIGNVVVKRPKRLREHKYFEKFGLKSRMSIFLNVQRQKTLNSSTPIWEKEVMTRTSRNNGIVISFPTYFLFFVCLLKFILAFE